MTIDINDAVASSYNTIYVLSACTPVYHVPNVYGTNSMSGVLPLLKYVYVYGSVCVYVAEYPTSPHLYTQNAACSL